VDRGVKVLNLFPYIYTVTLTENLSEKTLRWSPQKKVTWKISSPTQAAMRARQDAPS